MKKQTGCGRRPSRDRLGRRRSCGPRPGRCSALLVLLGLASAGGVRAATAPPFHARHGAVASDNAEASAAGLTILKAGGNAVDAACATALALGVDHGFASWLGSVGFALVHVAKEHHTYS